MLGFESERKLVNFFMAVRDGETSIEDGRQKLCTIYNFCPSSAFMRLDRDINNHITSFEIQNFLRDNREYLVTLKECDMLVKFFDSDEDGRLSYNE